MICVRSFWLVHWDFWLPGTREQNLLPGKESLVNVFNFSSVACFLLWSLWCRVAWRASLCIWFLVFVFLICAIFPFIAFLYSLNIYWIICLCLFFNNILVFVNYCYAHVHAILFYLKVESLDFISSDLHHQLRCSQQSAEDKLIMQLSRNISIPWAEGKLPFI